MVLEWIVLKRIKQIIKRFKHAEEYVKKSNEPREMLIERKDYNLLFESQKEADAFEKRAVEEVNRGKPKPVLKVSEEGRQTRADYWLVLIRLWYAENRLAWRPVTKPWNPRIFRLVDGKLEVTLMKDVRDPFLQKLQLANGEHTEVSEQQSQQLQPH